ncbi:MAG: hypothetical protein ACLQJR_25355 [Stellaceae bacterium]
MKVSETPGALRDIFDGYLGFHPDLGGQLARLIHVKVGNFGQRAAVNSAHEFTVAKMFSGFVLLPSAYLPGAR